MNATAVIPMKHYRPKICSNYKSMKNAKNEIKNFKEILIHFE